MIIDVMNYHQMNFIKIKDVKGIGIMVNNYRTCYVDDKKALFHRWCDIAKPIPPSMLIGGDPGGQIWNVLGLIEFEDGHIELIEPYKIMFCDNFMKEFLFNKGDSNENSK